MPPRCIVLLAVLLVSSPVSAAERALDTRLHHLRSGSSREWSDFPAQAEGPSLEVKFRAEVNAAEQTLRLRQQDVKQLWKLLLNGKELTRLLIDENDMTIYVPVPPGTLLAGENALRIASASKTPDDIRAGELFLDDRPVQTVLTEARLEVTVVDSDKKTPLPCRITVVNASGALQTLGAKSGVGIAVRIGVVYSGSGRAEFGLPAGTYTIHANRGFEYGVDSVRVTLKAGDTVRKQLHIRRAVDTKGYVACDTHVHTLTHSGHGDSSIDERMLTLAGEGIELPIATDHNVQIDYEAIALKHGVRQYFTPVVGNEVTTSVGHYCVFPVSPKGPIPDYKLKTWPPLFDSIEKAGAKVIVLNHPRDIHLGYRPFDPKHHNAVTGENLDGWALRANAAELINSGAVQTDPLLVFHDWFSLLNRGIYLTPIGSSDSHDVNRYIVGQARTYIRARDENPAKIDVHEAVANCLAGKVLVSYGLFTEITVNDRYGPGDLVPASEKVKVEVRVQGPGWTQANKVELFANGRKIRSERIADGKKAGVKWTGTWMLPRFKQDVHLVAIATGPAMREPFWPIAKPYQPTSPDLDLHVIGSTGAVWFDGDSDGKRSSAFDDAQKLLKASKGDTMKLIAELSGYDDAVAAQAASLLQAAGVSVGDTDIQAAAKKAGPAVERGFRSYFEAWRASQVARSK